MKALHLTSFITLALACSFGTQVQAQAPKKQPPPPPRTAPPSAPVAQAPKRQPSQRPQHPQTPPMPAPNAQRPQFGDPLPGLTRRELQEFNDGKEDFEGVETEVSGLGPIFNGSSCVICHSSPAVGGASVFNVTRFGQTTNGVFNPLTLLGGSLLQEREINAAVHEVVPPEANVVAQRNTTPLFGLGLIEAIPDAQILRNVRRQPVDGVLGKVSKVQDVATGRELIGRFGWKAQIATLLTFSGEAYVNEMGITNRLFPVENAPNGNAQLLSQYDTVADPEDTLDAQGRGDIDRLAEFMQWLGAPPRLQLTPSAAAGRGVFQSTGCTTCHVPVMFTGPNRSASLRNKEVWLFSDLLLHDMGTLGDGIAQGTADVRDMKTAPLWGLRASAPYLHDGRAATVDEAIKAHDGEAKAAKDRYLKLSKQQVQQLLDYLASI
ncbi:MAG: di-heme oxidoredictase family protein [Prosthecobacter sp.]|uniref:di-heme oxidoredictase family protein n=1 Tax=Prosthecobacter sp. TaxID=1965333 RepID=UPI003901A6E4